MIATPRGGRMFADARALLNFSLAVPARIRRSLVDQNDRSTHGASCSRRNLSARNV